MTVGYSGKPAYQKLGLQAGMRVLVVNAPADYLTLIGVPSDPPLPTVAADADLDYIHFFTKERIDLEHELVRLKALLQPAGMLWVSWPKKAAKIPTDVSEDVVRDHALANGLVDIKVCAIDNIWSGLKLVIPRKER